MAFFQPGVFGFLKPLEQTGGHGLQALCVVGILGEVFEFPGIGLEVVDQILKGWRTESDSSHPS